jgi:hypothetical protein
MTFITLSQAVTESRRVWSSTRAAESQLRKSAAASMDTSFDIFMSHSYEDAEVISGVKIMIERSGLMVYVDWVEDAQADRSNVTPETAEMLRQRMAHSRFLLYVSSKASPNSKWMPWELGYFDGLRNDHVGILPIVQSSGDGFKGQEYLGLYPPYELLNFTDHGVRLGRRTGASQRTGISHGELLETDARRLF